MAIDKNQVSVEEAYDAYFSLYTSCCDDNLHHFYDRGKNNEPIRDVDSSDKKAVAEAYLSAAADIAKEALVMGGFKDKEDIMLQYPVFRKCEDLLDNVYKFALTGESNVIVNENTGDEYTVYRIRALKDIPEKNVKRGDLGGFVECEDNLSHFNSCWVAGDAAVYDGAVVEDNALVKDNALVFGQAVVGACATVQEFACVSDKGVFIEDNALIGGSAVVCGDNVSIGGNAQVTGKSLVIGRDYSEIGGTEINGNVTVLDYANIVNCKIDGDSVVISENAFITDTEITGNVKVLGHSVIRNSELEQDAYISCPSLHTDNMLHSHVENSVIRGQARVSGCPKLNYVQMDDRASIESNAHVEHSVLIGKSYVGGNAEVSYSNLSENAMVLDHAVVSCSSKDKLLARSAISGDTIIKGNAKIYGEKISHGVIDKSRPVSHQDKSSKTKERTE